MAVQASERIVLTRARDVTIDKDLRAAIAVTRFGLGAKPGEIAFAREDPEGYLTAQIRPEGADQPASVSTTTTRRMKELRAYHHIHAADKRAGQDKSAPTKAARRLLRREGEADLLGRMQLGADTSAGFRERWALFWANHFTVSAKKRSVVALVGPFEQEAIRPRVFGRFEDLLDASTRHPAMLIYLDQAKSIGPDSPKGRLRDKGAKHNGLNENLAREIMELHTVGVGSGYTQADVTEFARALTGWSIDGDRELGGADDHGEGFSFRDRAHEPGARTIMNRHYAAGGPEQARAAMKDLAASPHTAHHIAVKLARHFVADDPPPTLVARLEQAYAKTDGHLGAVARALIEAPEAWDPAPSKFKTPYEFMISSWRAAGVMPDDAPSIDAAMTAMGQKPLVAPSPKGWPEEAQAWCAPDAVIKRMVWSEDFAAAATGAHDPVQLARNALGARLTPRVAKTIARAESRPEGFSILLMSPEFQRR